MPSRRNKPTRTLSKPDFIRLAACHTCAARRGQPCMFTRQEDPTGARAQAGQSHLDRIMRARRIADTQSAPEKKQIDLDLYLDDIRI